MSHPTHHLWFRGLFIFTWNNRNSCHTLTNKQSKHLTVHNLQNFHYMHLCLKNKNLYLIYIKGKYHFNGYVRTFCFIVFRFHLSMKYLCQVIGPVVLEKFKPWKATGDQKSSFKPKSVEWWMKKENAYIWISQ